MSSQLRADEFTGAGGVLGDSDTSVLHRVYSSARQAISERFLIDEEIERRLAIIVLFTYSAKRPDSTDPEDERELITLCVERLVAQTVVAAETIRP